MTLARLITKADKAVRRLVDKRMDCARCELCKNRQCVVMSTVRSAQVPLVLFGEAPGRKEDRTGEPFCGPSGCVFWELARMASVEPYIYPVNTVACAPWLTAGRREMGKPTVEQQAVCWEAIVAPVLRIIRPRCIICAGKEAASTLARCADGSALDEFGVEDVHYIQHPSCLLRRHGRAWRGTDGARNTLDRLIEIGRRFT